MPFLASGIFQDREAVPLIPQGSGCFFIDVPAYDGRHDHGTLVTDIYIPLDGADNHPPYRIYGPATKGTFFHQKTIPPFVLNYGLFYHLVTACGFCRNGSKKGSCIIYIRYFSRRGGIKIRRGAVGMVKGMFIRMLCTFAGFIVGVLLLRLYYLMVF